MRSGPALWRQAERACDSSKQAVALLWHQHGLSGPSSLGWERSRKDSTGNGWPFREAMFFLSFSILRRSHSSQ